MEMIKRVLDQTFLMLCDGLINYDKFLGAVSFAYRCDLITSFEHRFLFRSGMYASLEP